MAQTNTCVGPMLVTVSMPSKRLPCGYWIAYGDRRHGPQQCRNDSFYVQS